MADVQIQGSPEKGGANWAWAVVAIALIAVIAYFMFGRSGGSGKSSVTVDTSAATPKAP